MLTAKPKRAVVGKTDFVPADAPTQPVVAHYRYDEKPPEQPALMSPVEVAELRPPPSEVVAKFARMKRCEHWQKATDCGCGINRCALGRGDRGRVGHSDCFDCPDLPLADH